MRLLMYPADSWGDGLRGVRAPSAVRLYRRGSALPAEGHPAGAGCCTQAAYAP